ncbi:MAG: glycine cleavage system aminomethyltransferase GcvT [Dehalococcoidales bacterium]|nr:glycine cleavage system aminomethyltransferase GcvT [Dehalococcoidales bacterium]
MQTLRTPLNKVHHDLKAKIVEFAGWELPIWFTSILEEHRAVRSRAGIFDVSHMGRIQVSGENAGAFLDRMFTRPAQRLAVGSSQLCLMCLENGGILDDLFVYRVDGEQYLIIWNASHSQQKLDWVLSQKEEFPDVTVRNSTLDTAMLAVQGPDAIHLKDMNRLSQLPRFGHAQAKIAGFDVRVARTGYTGEDGFEVISEAADAVPLWESFTQQGVTPCGLGARDSLRLEAGMLLYGQDMDTSTNPFEADLGWLVDLDDTDFIGKQALQAANKWGIKRKLVGFQMNGREIARTGYSIYQSGREVGRVTSGSYAPTLGVNIGMGYVPIELATIGTDIQIMIRNQLVDARLVSKRFYKRR